METCILCLDKAEFLITKMSKQYPYCISCAPFIVDNDFDIIEEVKRIGEVNV